MSVGPLAKSAMRSETKSVFVHLMLQSTAYSTWHLVEICGMNKMDELELRHKHKNSSKTCSVTMGRSKIQK